MAVAIVLESYLFLNHSTLLLDMVSALDKAKRALIIVIRALAAVDGLCRQLTDRVAMLMKVEGDRIPK